jgi:DNA polymerase I-like protein with 3'-5' exonuclease and polymerase domains
MANNSWYTLIQTRQQFDEMWSALADDPLVGVDTETTGLDWWRHVIVGASFANRIHAWYMPVRHVEGNCPIEWLWEAGERLEGRPICGHNFGGFDMHMLTRERWKLRPHWHDSMIAAYCEL